MNAPPRPDKYEGPGDGPIKCSQCDSEQTLKTITLHPETGLPICAKCFSEMAKQFSLGDDKDLC